MQRAMMVLLSLLAITFAPAAPRVTFSAPQTMKRQPKKAPGRAALRGAVVRNNRARLKPGNVFVRKEENLVALQGKDEDVEEATFSCKCKSRGSCKVVTQGRNLWCEGCDECSLEVTKSLSQAEGPSAGRP